MKQRLASKGLGVRLLIFKHLKKAFRPRGHVSFFVSKLRFFAPFSKKSASTRCVFQLFLLVLTKCNGG